MMTGNAEILLVRKDGSLVLQVRDNKPGITNPGLISSFGGHIEDGEEPIDAAVREINEETSLGLRKDQLQFYRKCRKTKEVHGEDWDVFYFVATDVDDDGLKVYEGTGHTIIHNKDELATAKTTILLGQVLRDYFDGFRAFMFQANIHENALQTMLDRYYEQLCAGKKPSQFSQPVALACTGLVASGKSTVTAPLADSIGAVHVSSDKIRQMFFEAGYNFKQLRPFISQLLARLVAQKYNIFLDFNISTSIAALDTLHDLGYQIFVVHANPPEDFIKHKILSGTMKHELTFFSKDEFLYDSMLGWKDEHIAALPLLRKKYGIWHEVDTSRDDLPEIMQDMQAKFTQQLHP